MHPDNFSTLPSLSRKTCDEAPRRGLRTETSLPLAVEVSLLHSVENPLLGLSQQAWGQVGLWG